jgi:Uma2 family endonuclease
MGTTCKTPQEERMSDVHADPVPGIPARMTWQELAALPEELARQIELHDGRVVLVRTGPARHQRFYRRLAHALELCARADTRERPDHCWQVDVETNVFFNGDKSDFRTPDFMVYRCQDSGEDDIHARDVILAGKVLSPANSLNAIEAKKAKYASADIPWYWEADLEGDAIAAIRAYALELSANLPEGVVPLRPRNYILIGEWTPDNTDSITADLPFSIQIGWDTLSF